MSRSVVTAQSQRTQANPLVLGTFSETSLRYLRGSLGPKNIVVGRADTRSQSNGGFGGGTYNHWFQINLTKPGWIILAKGPPRPQYINVSAYDLNHNPIIGLPIFDADSVTNGINNVGEVYIPYLNTVMKAQSDLYNTFSHWRLDRGDDRYYALSAGSYLICISTTRNEPLQYEVGVVIEFSPTEIFISLEDENEISYILQETVVDFARTIEVPSIVTTNTTISTDVNRPNGFTENSCQINSGVTVTVLSFATWLIGEQIPLVQTPAYKILAEPANDDYFDTIHDHSLTEWVNSWESQHQDTNKFPDLFIPLTNRL